MARYIERNPVKAGLVGQAEEYRWSSARYHLTAAQDELLSHPGWLEPTARGDYADYCKTDNEEQNNAIRKATCSGRPLGTERFIDTIENELNRMVRVKKAGRPSKDVECDNK
nr:hypothetical protein [Desulfobulbaceae bacterium]